MSKASAQATFKLLNTHIDELRQILLDWDPIGIKGFVEPSGVSLRDEYDCLLMPLLSMLVKGKDVIEIARFLSDELENHFGIGSGKHETKVAAQVVSWYRSVIGDEHG